jgi:quercetin dioxygenase-like cupin family protein
LLVGSCGVASALFETAGRQTMTRSPFSSAPSRARAVAIGILFSAGLLVHAPTLATPASGFTAVQQWKGAYAPINLNTASDRNTDKDDKWDVKLMTKDTSDIYVTRNSIAIGGQSGWHSHPGPSLITVTVGTITAYESTDPACSPTTYHAGEGFVDYGDHAHLLRNESGSAAETVAVQFLPTGATRRIDEPKPTNCTF